MIQILAAFGAGEVVMLLVIYWFTVDEDIKLMRALGTAVIIAVIGWLVVIAHGCGQGYIPDLKCERVQYSPGWYNECQAKDTVCREYSWKQGIWECLPRYKGPYDAS